MVIAAALVLHHIETSRQSRLIAPDSGINTDEPLAGSRCDQPLGPCFGSVLPGRLFDVGQRPANRLDHLVRPAVRLDALRKEHT